MRRRTGLIATGALATALVAPLPALVRRIGWPAALGPAAGEAAATAPHAPAVRASSAYLLDVQTGSALFQKFPTTHRPMASTTKMMTALLAAESGRLDETVTVSRRAASVGETTMGLMEGEQLPMREVLYGMMMNSGNDAAIVIAEHLGGTVASFVEQMNARAAALGMADTLYTNPHGLDNAQFASEDLHSSARDLATVAAAVLDNPILRDVVSTRQKQVPVGPGAKKAITGPHQLRHTVTALWWYPGAIGVKTGWTGKAGQVRVVGAEREGRRLVAVVMDSPDNVREIRDLLDYGFALTAAPDKHPVPLAADDLTAPDATLKAAWETFKRQALTGEGRIKQGSDGTEGTADTQAAALLQAVWMQDRPVFDVLWGWSDMALSRTQKAPGNNKPDSLFASRWKAGNVTDWSNSTAADQRFAAALLMASRLWNESSYADAAVQILDAVIGKAAFSWQLQGVPATSLSIAAANSFLKDLDPVTISAASLTPAFYPMFTEATRSAGWLWMLDGAYDALDRATAPNGPLGGSAGLLPGWFSVAHDHGTIGQPVDPTWQNTGLTAESTALAHQLALASLWHDDRHAEALLRPVAQLVARELSQKQRVAASYTRSGAPAADTETTRYGALAGIASLEPGVQTALRAKLDAALKSNQADRVLDAMQGLWLLAGGPPDVWRLWNPPPDLPTTRNDSVVPPGDGYPWQYFGQTGHTVHGHLLEYFRQHGGVETFGLPRTDVFVEDGQTVQYFQRARMALDSDGASVVLAPLGRQAAEQRGILKGQEAAPVAPMDNDDDHLYLPEARHSVQRGFKTFFEKAGGANVLGLPLTEEFIEDGFTVQYFERAVLEYQAGKPIRASLLGDDLLKQKGWLK